MVEAKINESGKEPDDQRHENIFDYICDLQDQINGEIEMRQTFSEHF